jgi:glucose-6-phosphate 1-dehydrogenase
METPFVMVIFGATGDLARHKLIKAVFSLFKQNALPKDFFIVGFARRPFTNQEFAALFQSVGDVGNPQWEEFAKHLYYQQGEFEKREGYEKLITQLNKFDKQMKACVTRLFYLATPPDNYNAILSYLQETKLSEGCGQGSNKWTKLIIEKPFGKDLETARALDKKLSEIFEERQIFRVDHYLGKETVQNMIAFRFANGFLDPVWNKNYIDHVQITWAEKKGVGTRGKFFEGVGLLRDVLQNHLMQLIAAVTMDQPQSFSREAIRDSRAKAISSIHCLTAEEVASTVVRGQYNGYKQEKDILENSETETFVALKTFVDNDRFSGVPFYIRAGKKMPKDVVEISIVFIQTCHILFKEYGCPEEGNVLTIRIQPDEGIQMRVVAKKPGTKLSLGTVDMKFTYKDEFGKTGADAYEKLLLDILQGDQMLFNRSDELESSWEFITRILDGWQKGIQSSESSLRRGVEGQARIQNYEEATWGPKEAEELIQKDGRKWINNS